ncbi:MAG: ankyrin repeat domain-containing protein [bacterium]|jgi:ankyrin repeat protein
MRSIRILLTVSIIRPFLAVAMVVTAMLATAVAGEIHEAIKGGDLEAASRLIEADPALLEAPGGSGRTPLHYAAAYGRPDIARLLIEKGAAIDARDQGMATPLRIAAVANQHETATVLLEAGADTEIPDDYGRTPLLICARETGDVEMARLLLDHGADVNREDRFGDTPIVLSAWRGFAGQVDLFLDRGADTPIDGDCGRQLVEYSVAKGLVRLFSVLDAEGADFTEVTESGWTKLHSAASGGSTEITGKLLDRGLDVNAADLYGYTPLHYAAKRGRTDVARLLVSKGASMESLTLAGDRPYDLAVSWNHDLTAGELADAGASTAGPQFPVFRGKYLGQKPPGMVPEVFAPGVVSTCDGEHGCATFSPDGDQVYWATSFMLTDTGYSTGSLFGMWIEDGKWTKPRMTPFSETLDHDGDVPFFSPDGKRLYFISRRTPEGGEDMGPEKIWFVEREGGGWSAARPLEWESGAFSIHWQFAITDDGTLYFSGSGPDSRGMGDIYALKREGDAYGEPENLGEPVSTEAHEGAPYVAPDGSMLLFSSLAREGGVGGADIYLCRPDGRGGWTEPVNLGEPVNSGYHEMCPMISPDGKYLFFISQRSQTSDIFWVDAAVLDGL